MYNQLLSFALKSTVYGVKKLNCTVERLVKLVMIQSLKRIKTKTLESKQISNLLSTEIVKKKLLRPVAKTVCSIMLLSFIK